ncbi:PucR family transcriptional regulator ligand-binding domain-containing protein [Kitasatospora sp. NPDC059646]|uniref:PucR family transcriptional regulator n=1 Tax=Kitasatospora sp. NPDC059646 TaxID=3346893 RepID=UPI00368E34EB
MSITLGDLLSQEDLRLRLCTGGFGTERVVRWAAATELADPTPWMTGGELLLTTGLRQRSPDAQAAFVRRVAAAGAAGVGFGTGPNHPTVPVDTVAEAERLGLPVLEVPPETPFIAVNRLIAARSTAGAADRSYRLLDRHDLLVRALLEGGGLTALLRALHRIYGSEVAVVDRHGALLAAAPGPCNALLDELQAGPASPEAPDRTGLVRLPVRVDGTLAAQLCLRSADPAELLPYAARLVGLELARRQAYLAGRRELVGQVVEDVVRDVIAPAAAERRLAAFGLDPTRSHRVVLGCPDPDGAGTGRDRRLARLPWPADDCGDPPEPLLTAVVDRYLVAVVPQCVPVEAPALRFAAVLSGLDARAAVGIGGCYQGVEGLRWSPGGTRPGPRRSRRRAARPFPAPALQPRSAAAATRRRGTAAAHAVRRQQPGRSRPDAARLPGRGLFGAGGRRPHVRAPQHRSLPVGAHRAAHR